MYEYIVILKIVFINFKMSGKFIFFMGASSSNPQTLQTAPKLESIPQTPQFQSKQPLQPTVMFNEKQLASYDIPKEDEKIIDYMESNNLLMQFQNAYSNLYKERTKYINENCLIDINQRLNISILIIISSSITEKKSKHLKAIYQENAEDLSSALFIRHIFHYAFGIPYNQILVASTQNKDFCSDDNEKDLISKPNTIFKGIEDIDLIPKDQQSHQDFNYGFDNSFLHSFLFTQHINITQIGDKQYKFLVDDYLSNIVYPFNDHIIKMLKTNQNSHLLVFFLDHGYSGEFGESFPYEFFIERIIKIECKHIYVFNDSCCSGSLINLIKYCKSFNDIFPNINDPTLESALFYFLTNISKVYPDSVQETVDNKLDTIQSYDIDQKNKEKLKEILQNLSTNTLHKISEFVLNYDVEFKKVGCVPQFFLQFANKATIFSSSAYNEESFTLPGRYIKTTYFRTPRIRVFGSIFTSIFIKSLLSKKGQLSLGNFCENVGKLLGSYKQKFMPLIISQNEVKKDIAENFSLPSRGKIISFFSRDSFQKVLFFNSNNDWPDLRSIMVEKIYWNIDQTEVNPKEYENVFFCAFKKHDVESPIENPNNFGPEKGLFYMDKFIKDFELAVKILIESNKLNATFSIKDLKVKAENKVIDKNNEGYGEFIGLIRPVITNYNWKAVVFLKTPLTIFFEENSNDFEKYANIFAESFKNIMPFWKDYNL